MALLLLDACQNLNLKEKDYYGSKQGDGAVLFHQFSTATKQISEDDWEIMWNNVSDPMIAMRASDFAEGKKEIENACALLKKCTEPAVKKALVFFKRVDNYVVWTKKRNASLQ